MSATALTPDNTKPGAWSLARVQDDLTRNYNPAGPFEAMLITQMAQTFVRLQAAYDVDRRYREGRDMLAVITTKPAEFKAVQGYVRDCERAWNHAKENLEKAQRKRQREKVAAPAARPAQERNTSSSVAAPPPPSYAAPVTSSAASKRE